jgi:hypothetical protein
VASRDRRHCDVRCVMTLDVLWRGVTRALRHPDIRIKPSPGGGGSMLWSLILAIFCKFFWRLSRKPMSCLFFLHKLVYLESRF